jgi:hypothetical protein
MDFASIKDFDARDGFLQTFHRDSTTGNFRLDDGSQRIAVADIDDPGTVINRNMTKIEEQRPAEYDYCGRKNRPIVTAHRGDSARICIHLYDEAVISAHARTSETESFRAHRPTDLPFIATGNV